MFIKAVYQIILFLKMGGITKVINSKMKIILKKLTTNHHEPKRTFTSISFSSPSK